MYVDTQILDEVYVGRHTWQFLVLEVARLIVVNRTRNYYGSCYLDIAHKKKLFFFEDIFGL